MTELPTCPLGVGSEVARGTLASAKTGTQHGRLSGGNVSGTSPRTKSPRPACGRCGSAHIGAPRPTWSRVTTADGRSPGLRVFTIRRLPRTEVPSGNLTEDSPLTVAGAAADSSEYHSHRIPIFLPTRDRHGDHTNVQPAESTTLKRSLRIAVLAMGSIDFSFACAAPVAVLATLCAPNMPGESNFRWWAWHGLSTWS